MKIRTGSTMLLIAVVLLSFDLLAEETGLKVSSIVSREDKVVIAVHPYFSKADRNLFRLAGRVRRSTPVGVLIQNYGKERISIERVELVSKGKYRLDIPQFTPYSERPLGAIADRQFFDDGTRLNSFLRGEYMANEPVPWLGVNEIFYAPWLDAGKSFYGLVYLERRDRRYRPARIKTLDGLEIEIVFRGGEFLKGYIAKIPLDGSETGVVEPLASNDEEPYFKCEHTDCNKMSGRSLYEMNKFLNECYAKSCGKNTIYRREVFGKYAAAWVEFDRNGDYLSHTVSTRSGEKKIDRSLNAIARGMKHCNLPKTEFKTGAPDKEHFYSLKITVGDAFTAKSK